MRRSEIPYIRMMWRNGNSLVNLCFLWGTLHVSFQSSEGVVQAFLRSSLANDEQPGAPNRVSDGIVV